jgi:signal recognition particle receptor subunit beta
MKLMDLRGFAVELERNASASEEVRLFDVPGEVRAWMNASFAAQLVTLGWRRN